MDPIRGRAGRALSRRQRQCAGRLRKNRVERARPVNSSSLCPAIPRNAVGRPSAREASDSSAVARASPMKCFGIRAMGVLSHYAAHPASMRTAFAAFLLFLPALVGWVLLYRLSDYRRDGDGMAGMFLTSNIRALRPDLYTDEGQPLLRWVWVVTLLTIPWYVAVAFILG